MGIFAMVKTARAVRQLSNGVDGRLKAVSPNASGDRDHAPSM